MAMCILSLLPVGSDADLGLGGAGLLVRSQSRVLAHRVMQTLRWLRVPGDTIFALGAIALVLFVAGLKTGHSIQKEG